MSNFLLESFKIFVQNLEFLQIIDISLEDHFLSSPCICEK